MAAQQAFQRDDQTPSEYKSERYVGVKGTGLLRLRNYNKLLPIKNTTYDAFIQTAEEYSPLAIKWIPLQASSFERLQMDHCGEQPCVNSCVKPGCICDRETKKCIGL